MKLAVIRIRGRRKISPNIEKTLGLLRLERPNHCILLDDSAQNIGMLNIVKDYVTFGPVEEVTIFKLLCKRGKKGRKLLRAVMKEEEIKQVATEISSGKKAIEFVNPVFRLRPPSKGYKDTKSHYPKGDLGKRQEMDSLLRRMI
ncbi:uL30 family ribosomal protein [Candidatus Micrarchaeota archaeon]|nr:uL30 family ribosomal protein [Candidatus Micrarchaeota archaeon]